MKKNTFSMLDEMEMKLYMMYYLHLKVKKQIKTI